MEIDAERLDYKFVRARKRATLIYFKRKGEKIF